MCIRDSHDALARMGEHAGRHQQPFFSALALGDVMQGRDQVQRGATGIAHHLDRYVGPEQAAILATITLLKAVAVDLAAKNSRCLFFISGMVLGQGDLRKGQSVVFLLYTSRCV